MFEKNTIVRSQAGYPKELLSRRQFLKLLALGVASASSSMLGACQPVDPIQATALPSQTPSPTPEPRPSSTATVVEESAPAKQANIVRTRHPGVWQGETLDPAALREMLDASLARLTHIEDAQKAWESCFKPHERVAIKVNSIIHGSTHLALALAVAERLQDAGVPAEQITLYDRSSQELRNSGFPVSTSGDGLRCTGTDGQLVDGWEVNGSAVSLSQVLAECDALINIPILKAFSLGGLSFAMKNHYGSVDNPSRFHGMNFAPGITGLNALEPIRDRTRLIIGDVLTQETHQDEFDYVVVGGTKALLMGTDPVAIDSIGLQMSEVALESLGVNIRTVQAQAGEWLQAGADAGLGVFELAQINISEIGL